MKYVQNCEHVSFSYDDEDIEDDEYDEYEPFNKKHFKDISSDDIDEILSEFNFAPECSEKERLKFNWNDTFGVGTGYDTVDDNYDSVVPDNEVFEYPGDDDYLDELLRNRTNCTVTRYTKETKQLDPNYIWH